MCENKGIHFVSLRGGCPCSVSVRNPMKKTAVQITAGAPQFLQYHTELFPSLTASWWLSHHPSLFQSDLSLVLGYLFGFSFYTTISLIFKSFPSLSWPKKLRATTLSQSVSINTSKVHRCCHPCRCVSVLHASDNDLWTSRRFKRPRKRSSTLHQFLQ